MGKKLSDSTNPNSLGASIRRAREARGWSQARLAQTASTSQQTVNRIELGKTTHSRALSRIIELLELSPDLLFESLGFVPSPDEDEYDFNSAPTLPKSPNKDVDAWMPVYSSYFLGNMTSDHPASFINTPEPLMNVRGAYGIIVSGVDMSPALRSGDTALINPHLPPREGDDVVMKTERSTQVRFGTITRIDADTIGYCTWNPPADHRVSRAMWLTCHVVVGKFSRR